MLMALLPLAGWADNLADCTISVPNVVYGTTSFGTGYPKLMYGATTLTEGTDYEIVDGYYLTADATDPVMNGTSVATLAQLSVGDYYIKFIGKGGYATTSASKMFSVTGKLLTTAMISSTPIEAQTYTGSAITPSTTGRLTDGETLVEGTDYTVAFSNNINASTAAKVTYTGIGDYSGTIDETFTINAKPLTTAMITPVELEDTYKGSAFTEFAVNVMDGTTALVPGTDFDVVASTTANDWSTEVSPVNVGTYYLGIKAKTGANYTLSATTAAGTFKVNTKGLTIRALAQSKYYDTTKDLPSTALGTAYEVLGAVSGDSYGSVSLSGNTSADYKAGGYTITPSVGTENGNYDYNYVTATFTINKRPLKITAVDAKKVLNKAETTATKNNDDQTPTTGAEGAKVGYAGVILTPTLATGETWSLPSGEIENMVATYNKSSKPAGGSLVVSRTGAGTDEARAEYPDALTVSYESKGTVWNNYEITTEAGDFEITGGKIYITALDQEKNYGDADPSWTAALDENYIVSGLSTGESLTTEPTLTRAEGETVGPYTISVAGAVAPTGYEEIQYVTATFTIKARPLKVTAKTQTLKVGQTAADLDQTLYEIDPTTTLKDGDTADEVFSLAFKSGVPSSSTLATSDAADDAIIVTGGAKAANYDLTGCVAGKLVVVAADAIVLNDGADIATTAATSKDVTFTDRKLNGGKWNVLVLPFATSAKAISTALDYAVIDVFDTNSSDGNVRFKLNVTAGNSATDVIAANTPFLVYPTADINLNTVVFSTVDVVAASANVEVADKGGNKFIGTYKNTTLTATTGKEYQYMSGGTFYDLKAGATTTLKPLRAYLDLSGSTSPAPIIYIEEPNGNTTAINTVTGATSVLKAEGSWYTINGVKLQGMPTQKGIYIKNGKKVVIK